MMRSLLSIVLLAALAACTAERAPAGDAAPPPVADAAPPVATPPVADTPAPVAAPAAHADGGPDAQARFDGYGQVAFGTLAADMERTWGGQLEEVGKEYNAACYFMTPAWVKVPAEFNFMLSDGKFARYGTESGKVVAPGGGKVGMREAELQALYNLGLKATPHEYVQGGKYLSIAASGVAPSKLVFETDARGVVTEWRVGLLPEVDFVEGCS